jgi:hypothetical protein
MKRITVLEHECLGGPEFCAFEFEIQKLLNIRPDGTAKGKIVGSFRKLPTNLYKEGGD